MQSARLRLRLIPLEAPRESYISDISEIHQKFSGTTFIKDILFLSVSSTMVLAGSVLTLTASTLAAAATPVAVAVVGAGLLGIGIYDMHDRAKTHKDGSILRSSKALEIIKENSECKKRIEEMRHQRNEARAEIKVLAREIERLQCENTQLHLNEQQKPAATEPVQQYTAATRSKITQFRLPEPEQHNTNSEKTKKLSKVRSAS